MQEREQDTPLADDVGKSIERAIDALLALRQDEDDGRQRRGTHAQIQRETGIARSTLRKFGRGGNPDLKTLCRLAEALDVSPALLLMTRRDWQAVVSAAKSWREATELARNARVAQSTGLAKVEVGVRIVEKLAPPFTLPDFDESCDAAQADVNRNRVQNAAAQDEARRRRARAATAIAQAWSERPSDTEVLTAFAALVGATH